jgi:hypothetical protein
MNFRLLEDLPKAYARSSLTTYLSYPGDEGPSPQRLSDAIKQQYGLETHLVQSPGGDLWLVFKTANGSYWADGYGPAIHVVAAMAQAINEGDWEAVEALEWK